MNKEYLNYSFNHMMTPAPEHHGSPTLRLGKLLSNLYKWYRYYVDRTTPHVHVRWISFAILLTLFMLRIVTYQGFYVIAYALGIYLLNIFLLFLSPRFDPDSDDNDDTISNHTIPSSAAVFLPTRADDEFRPFIRRLPEFTFWYNATWSTSMALIGTLFGVLDVPVFWPILLFYFVLLTVLTLKRQIAHMIKHKYIPFDMGKKHYTGR